MIVRRFEDKFRFTAGSDFLKTGGFPWASFDCWRKRLGYLVGAALVSGMFLGYRFADAWSFNLIPSMLAVLLFCLPVLGALFLWWVWTELTNIPGTVKEATFSAASVVVPLEKSDGPEGVYVLKESSTQTRKSGFLIRSLRAFFRAVGVYWDLSDIPSSIGLAMSLLNPVSIMLLGFSLLFSSLMIVVAVVYALLLMTGG